MDAKEIKLYIYENDKIEEVLEAWNMHHIKWHDNKGYITCGVPDGDNPSSTVIYNNEFLNVKAYTRDIVDVYEISDIFSLVQFVNGIGFRESLGWVCDVVGIDNNDFFFEKPDNTKQLIKKIRKYI